MRRAWLLMVFSFNTYPPFATVSLLAEVNCRDLKHKLNIGLSFTAFAEHLVHMFMLQLVEDLGFEMYIFRT
jgi:hypothetical protein